MFHRPLTGNFRASWGPHICGLSLISFPGLQATIKMAFYSSHNGVSIQKRLQSCWMKSFFPSSLIIKKSIKRSPFWTGQKVKMRVKATLTWWHNLQSFSCIAIFLIVLPWIWTCSSRPHLLCRPMPVRQEVGPHLGANSFSTDVYRLVRNHKITEHLKRIS